MKAGTEEITERERDQVTWSRLNSSLSQLGSQILEGKNQYLCTFLVPGRS